MLGWVRRRERGIRAEAMAAATADRLVLSEREGLEEEWPAAAAAQSLRREGLAALRAEVRGAGALAGLEGERVESFALAVTEAATNALLHAGGGWYRVQHRDGTLRARVWDRGGGIRDADLLRATLCAGWSSRGSMGLGWKAIVEGCDQVRLSTDALGTTVILELRGRPVPPLLGAAAALWAAN